MDIYVVNLAKDTIKKKYMESHLNEFDLAPVYIQGVYGQDLSDDELKKFYKEEAAKATIGRALGHGEIGCFLSHLNIYFKMLNDNVKYALILEDDIELKFDIKLIIDELLISSSHWEIVLLGHHSRFSRTEPTLPSFWGRKKLSKKYSLSRPCDLGQGTYGYLISLAGAKKMLKFSNKIDRPIDHYTGSDQFTNLYIINPPVININKHLSDNHHSMEERSINLQSLTDSTRLSSIKKLPGVRELILVKDCIRSLFYQVKPIRSYKPS